MRKFTFIYRSSGVWYIFDVLIDATEAAVISGGDEISTAHETRSQTERQSAVVARRLVRLAGSYRVPVTTGSLRPQSRALGRSIRQWYVSYQMEFTCVAFLD